MIPDPSKRPFTHPLDLPALAFFCHPRHEAFARPVRHPDGAIYAANGYLALRISRGPVTHDEDIPAADPVALDRLVKLPWERFTARPEQLVAAPWRAFDDVRGRIYADGLLPLWPGGRMTAERPVWTGEAMMVPLATLQLLARLPRCEIRIDGGRDFALLRFSGGEGILADRWRHARPQDIPPHVLSLFKPRAAGLPGGLI